MTDHETAACLGAIPLPARADDEGDDGKAFYEGEVLPITVTPSGGIADGAETSDLTKDIKRPPARKNGALSRIASLILCVFFCSVSLFFLVSYAADKAEYYFSGNGKPFYMDEVLPGYTVMRAEERKEEEKTDVGADENTEKKEDADPSFDPTPRDGTENTQDSSHPIEPDLQALLSGMCAADGYGEIAEKYGDSAPAVLIVHTHGTEAFAPEGADTYCETDPFRSSDADENVVSVGRVISKVLESEGIRTIHCTEMFDEESYKDSYSRSRASVAEYLKEYPSLTYVFDVHRDSIVTDRLENVKTSSSFNGAGTAQAMIVVGTNEAGADHPNWNENLSFALRLQNEMFSLCPTLPRCVNLRSAAFNQGLSPGYLLIEIGSSGNTLKEAERCGVLFALAVSKTLTGSEPSLSAEEYFEIFTP